MANKEHLKILEQGVDAWNRWREENPEIRPNLSGANLIEVHLSKAHLRGANLSKVNLMWTNLSKANLIEANLSKANLRRTYLSEADLRGAKLIEANLRGANLNKSDLSGANLSKSDLSGANLIEANLSEANLGKANLTEANLSGANLDGANLREATLSEANLNAANLSKVNLNKADLSEAYLGKADLNKANLNKANLNKANLSGAYIYEADLSKANLMSTQLIKTNLEKANLTNCFIYGISAWDLKLDGAKQSDLIITPPGEPIITVDNLEVAQFIYLLLYNEKIRLAIDTITSKAVLILGRFIPEQKAVLDAVKEELRRHDYLPILFDFEKPASRDLTETISTLAHLSRFVIVDITEPRSVPHELQAIIPTLAVPIQPLIQGSSKEYGMFSNFKKYHWVLKIYRYDNLKNLLASLEKEVIIPAEAKVKELKKRNDHE